ncbi:MAG: hypothetical protein KGP28_07685 [Bdellovibrionales bacterium]|nr:hypothetical protein [Bdellovibrionales bacterium]
MSASMFVSLFMLSMTVEAVPVSAAEKNEVMDFEADVIEGEKKAPELFLQLDSDTTDLGAVLYDRKTFNDFHANDRSRRPRLSSPRIVK